MLPRRHLHPACPGLRILPSWVACRIEVQREGLLTRPRSLASFHSCLFVLRGRPQRHTRQGIGRICLQRKSCPGDYRNLHSCYSFQPYGNEDLGDDGTNQQRQTRYASPKRDTRSVLEAGPFDSLGEPLTCQPFPPSTPRVFWSIMP